MINIEALVAGMKEKRPEIYGHMDDREVYKSIRSKKPHLDWPESDPYEAKVDLNLNHSPDRLDASKLEQEHSPQSFADLALAGLPEVWADKHDWAKRSYNNSMAGLGYQIAYGEPKYEVDEYSSGVWEDVGGLSSSGVIEASAINCSFKGSIY